MRDKKIIILIIVTMTFLMSLPVLGQKIGNGVILINHVKELINDDSFDEAIKLIDENLNSDANISDSIRAELYYNKFIAQWNIGKKSNMYNEEKDNLKKAIDLYENLDNKNKERLASFYRSYLHIINPSWPSYEEYEAYVLKLFKNGSYYASDYKFIQYLFCHHCKKLETSQERLEKFDSIASVLENRVINPQYFNTYLQNIKANILSRYYLSYNNYYKTKDDNLLRDAIPLYVKCIKEYKKNESREPVEKLLCDCLEDAMSALEDLQLFDIAAIYMQDYMSLVHKNWERWDAMSPWAYYQSWNHKMFAYEKYMDYLESSNQFDLAISYSQQVLKEIGEYDIKNGVEYVKSYINYFEDLKIAKEQKTLYDTGLKERKMSDLYFNGDFDMLEQVADSIIYSTKRSFLQNDYDHISQYFENVEYTKEEDILFGKRVLWFSDDYSDYWEALSYKALIASSKGNIIDAIKYQEEVIDIVKIDYKFTPNLRESLIMGHQYLQLQRISTEIFQYLNLAEYYFEAKRNKDALYCLNIALNSSIDILSAAMIGSDIAKYDIWHDTFETLNSILSVAMRYHGECPEVADLVVDIFSLTKGVLKNEKISVREAILNYNGTENKEIIRKEYNDILDLDRKIDITYYTNKKTEREQLMIERAIHQVYIDGKIDGKQIVRSSHVNIERIREQLKKGDLYLDFMEFSTPADTTEYVFVDSLGINNWTIKVKNRSTFFAVAYKPEWEHARLIKVCDNITKIGEGLGALTGFARTNSQKIYKFYTSPVATNFVWGEILKEANLSEGANIYFIPISDFASIAIEQMQMEDGRRICDKFNCYRLTSAHEIVRRSTAYTNDDQAAIFYDMDYSWVNSPQMLPTFKKNLSNPHGDAIKNAMQRMFASNLRQYSGSNSTEQNLVSLSGNSPAYLHLTTHGFNNLYYKLEQGEREYLMGHRPEYQSQTDESMFRTGIYMSSSAWNMNPSNDGLLTSHEISMLDLSNTKLCILSACSTASGRWSLDGVFGLQRAFKLAGVKTLIVSLWDVDDKATELLMSKFYSYMSQKLSPREALQKAQLDVKNHVSDDDYLKGLDNVHRYENPYYWAGFILLDAN